MSGSGRPWRLSRVRRSLRLGGRVLPMTRFGAIMGRSAFEGDVIVSGFFRFGSGRGSVVWGMLIEGNGCDVCVCNAEECRRERRCMNGHFGG